MIHVTPGEDFRVVLHQRTTRTHLLLVFYSLSTCTHVRCIVPATGDDPIIAVVSDTSPTAAVALDGEVVLSPGGEWELTVYAQSSDTDLDETSNTARDTIAGKLGVFVDSSCCAITAYTPETQVGTCDPATVTINGDEVATPASGGTAALLVVDQTDAQVGSWNGTAWEVNTGGTACPFDLIVNVDGVEEDAVADVDPCVDNTVNVNISYS